jgi:hypothetical protein
VHRSGLKKATFKISKITNILVDKQGTNIKNQTSEAKRTGKKQSYKHWLLVKL